MELPRRARGDELLPPGELTAIRRRLRRVAGRHDLTSVIACAFDHRTRMLPFVYADMRMAPAGVRAIGSAMLDAGFPKTRIVLQQWSRNFRPSRMRLDGRVPDLFMVSSMRIHSAQCEAMIRDVCRIGPADRPLVIAGGPKIIYEPWSVFSADPADPWGADVAVTGEQYVLLDLIETLLAERGEGESMRETFLRVRDRGALDGVPGLVYARGRRDAVPEELIDTGIQRLVGDLDELPDPVGGYRILERPSGRATLAARPIPDRQVRRATRMGGIVLTLGCKYGCPYCPIPAYNQRQLRFKSGPRIAEDFARLYRRFKLKYFFGADDNFFNDPDRALAILEAVARKQYKKGRALHRRINWGTEVTVQDTLKMKEHLPVAYKAGVRALWLGVEDMTATLIRKGQSVDKTLEVFHLLGEQGIAPMPMMMHHDSQPLYTPGRPYGLLNQVRLLKKAGAASLQVLMITPATGSRSFEETYTSGQTYRSVGGKRVEPRMFDGNYVISSSHAKPWRKQINIMAAYLYFYNPLRMLRVLARPKDRLFPIAAAMQVIGMWGLALTIRRTLGWMLRLLGGRVKRQSAPPVSPIPMRAADGAPASHALPGTPTPDGTKESTDHTAYKDCADAERPEVTAR